MKKILLWGAFLCVVSFSFGCPHIIMSKMLKSEGKEYTPLTIDNFSYAKWDEVGYALRVRRAYDGRYFDSGYFFPPALHPFLFAFLSHAAGSMEKVFILGDFIFPPILFLMVYLLLMKITARRSWSVLGSSAVLYGHHLLSAFPPVTLTRARTFIGYLVNYADGRAPLEFSRLADSQFTFILVIAAFYFFYRSLSQDRILHGAIAGVFLALLFYCYMYFWTFFLGTAGILFVWFLLRKEWKKALLSAIPPLIGLVLSIPLWLSVPSTREQGYQELLIRYGLEQNRLPTLPGFYLFFAACFVLIYRARDLAFRFLTAGFLSGMILLNINVVTGMTILKNHWNSRILQQWIIMMIVVLLKKFAEQDYHWPAARSLVHFLRKQTVLLCAVFTLGFIGYGYYTHVRFAVKNYSDYTLPSELREAFEWLNRNTPNGSVVLSCSFKTSFLLSAYTHNEAYLPNGLEKIMTNEELSERFIIVNKIFNVPSAYVEELMTPDNPGNKRLPADERFGTMYLFHFNQGYLSNERKKHILERLSRPVDSLETTRYPLDYLITGIYDDRIRGDDIRGVTKEEAYRNKKVVVYKVR